MKNFVKVSEALEALKKAGFAADHIEGADGLEYIEAEKEGVCMDLPILMIDGVEMVWEPTWNQSSSIEKLISYCETTVLIENRAKTGDEFE